MFIDTRFTKSSDENSLVPAEIRRHRNGSIDLDHYVRIGREAHGVAFRGGVRSFARIFRHFFGHQASMRGAASVATPTDGSLAPAE